MKTLKNLSIAFVLMLAFTVSFQSVANTPDVSSDPIELKTEPIKTQIDPAKLPMAVKDAIEDGEYAEWNIDKAYKVTFNEEPEKVEYEVHFKNAEKQKEVELYNKEGKEIDED